MFGVKVEGKTGLREVTGGESDGGDLWGSLKIFNSRSRPRLDPPEKRPGRSPKLAKRHKVKAGLTLSLNGNDLTNVKVHSKVPFNQTEDYKI